MTATWGRRIWIPEDTVVWRSAWCQASRPPPDFLAGICRPRVGKGHLSHYHAVSCYGMQTMIAVVQRVSEASVTVEETGHHERIGPGLCVLLGVEQGDTEREADWLAGKIARLRIFRDDEERMNRSVMDVGGEVLVVSQFTLAGNCSKGNRPSFIAAAEPALGEQLYQRVCEQLRGNHNLPVKQGLFGAMMQVKLVNDGPVTLIVQKKPEHGMKRLV